MTSTFGSSCEDRLIVQNTNLSGFIISNKSQHGSIEQFVKLLLDTYCLLVDSYFIFLSYFYYKLDCITCPLCIGHRVRKSTRGKSPKSAIALTAPGSTQPKLSLNKLYSLNRSRPSYFYILVAGVLLCYFISLL